jgi:hypothetical protein
MNIPRLRGSCVVNICRDYKINYSLVGPIPGSGVGSAITPIGWVSEGICLVRRNVTYSMGLFNPSVKYSIFILIFGSSY